MKNKIGILLLTFLISGCSSDVYQSRILEVKEFCSKNDGLKRMEVSYFLGSIDEVQCNDNAIYKLKTISFRHYTSNGNRYNSEEGHYTFRSKYIIRD